MPSARRALPCTLAPHAQQALAQLSPGPGGTPASPQGHPWPRTPQDRALVLIAPPTEGVGRPASVGGRGQVGTGRGAFPRSTTRRGAAASLRSAWVSGARTLPFSLSGSPDPLAVPTERAQAPVGRQPRPPPSNSPPLSGEAWSGSGESAELAPGRRNTQSQRCLR